jgi:stage IV sporulation protein A
MEDAAKRERATDELPQSAAGRTIMTTEPKFVPEQAAEVPLHDHAVMRVRLIDCVGYIVPSSLGYFENEQPRMVRTPWFDEEIPFNMAAEIGTGKVITDHSTIGLVITTDGSISDIPREEYAEAEQRVIQELSELGKPFVILLNTREPNAAPVQKLKAEMEEKYGRPVTAVSCMDLTEKDIIDIMQQILYEFPLREAEIFLPRWILSLKSDHWLRGEVFNRVREAAASVRKLRDVRGMAEALTQCEQIARAEIDRIDLGEGLARIRVELQPQLFYQVLSETTGLELRDESELMPCLTELADCRKKYERLRQALDEVEATGYGIVMPEMEELRLEEPEIVKQGGKYGVRLRASAPSIHMMRAEIQTEVSPIVGSERQSEELVMGLLKEFEENPAKIWESNIFGKSLHALVNEGLHAKLGRMPQDARLKLAETIERIINDGCNGLLCLIL